MVCKNEFLRNSDLWLGITPVREIHPSVVLQQNDLLVRMLSSQLGCVMNKSLVVVNVALAHPIVVEEKVILVRQDFEDVFHR